MDRPEGELEEEDTDEGVCLEEPLPVDGDEASAVFSSSCSVDSEL